MSKKPAICLILTSIFLLGCSNAISTVEPAHTAISPLATPISPTSAPIATKVSVASFPSGWTTFTNANERIGDLAFDQNGYLWAASQGGLVKWDLSNGTYQKIMTADGLPSNRIDSVLVAKDGTLWVSASGSISSFDGKSWKVYKDQERQGLISEIYQDSKGKLWFVGNAITTFDGTIWKTYEIKDGLGSNSASSIAEDHQHNIWLGTWFTGCGCESSPKYVEGVSRYNGKKWDVLSKEIGLDDNDPISRTRVTTMEVDASGGIWFGTIGFGAKYYSGKDTKSFTTVDGLAGPSVFDIKIDHTGAVWFATENGVSVYRENSWMTYSTQDGLSDNLVLSIAIAADQSLWFGTANGISRFDKEKWNNYYTGDGLPLTFVNKISSGAGGSVWLATDKGAAHFDGNTLTVLTKKDGLPNDAIKEVEIAPDGSFWFGTQPTWSPDVAGPVFHLDKGKWATFSVGYMPNEGIHGIVFDEAGGVWAGSYGSYYFDGTQWSQYVAGDGYDVVHSDKIAFSKKSGYWTGGWGGVSRYDGQKWFNYGPQGTKDSGWDIRAIDVAPNGDVWVASDLSDETFHTETGFKSFDGEKWVLETRLDNSQVTDMDFSPDGILWVATREGAYKYDGKNWTHYTVKDGLAGNEIMDIHVAGDGAIWFATFDGLTRFGK